MNVKEELLDYINCEENNGAILLTGNWGCGKTYLVKQMIEEKDLDFAFITVSLFGIDTIEVLNRKVKEKLLFAQIGVLKNEKTRRKANAAVKSISNLGELTKVSKGFKTVFSTDVYDFVDIKNEIPCVKNKQLVIQKVVLIFDDFERCKIPKIDLLGAINEYTENYKIKTVLIANEEYISEEKEYKDFKEKLVSRSIKLTSDYEFIIEEIIENYNCKSNEYKTFLEKNKDKIIRTFLDSKCENLRILKSLLIDFERIFVAWKKTSVSETDFTNVFFSNAVLYFEYKIGGYSKTEKYGYMFLDGVEKNYLYYTMGQIISAISDWVIKYDWDEEEFIFEITNKFYSQELSIDQIFLRTNFWSLEQKIIDEGLPVALEKSYKGELSCSDLSNLLEKLAIAASNEMDFGIKIDYEKMHAGLDIREEKLKNGELSGKENWTTFFPEGISSLKNERATELGKRLDNMMDKVWAIKRYKKFSNYLTEPDRCVLQSSDYGPITCFDDEMSSTFYNSFVGQGNGIKREMILVLGRMCFDYRYASTKKEIEQSIKNLKELGERIREKGESLGSKFEQAIYFSVANRLKEIVEGIENKKG